MVSFGERSCSTAEYFKAWSQNLGHKEMMTTFFSYGEVQLLRQAEIFRQFHNPQTPIIPSLDEFAKAVAREVRNQTNS